MKPALKRKIETIIDRKIIGSRALSGGKVSRIFRLDLEGREALARQAGERRA